jgi:hypothetical protein
VRKYWWHDAAGTLHAVLELDGRAEAFCGAAVEPPHAQPVAPGAPLCPHCYRTAAAAGRNGTTPRGSSSGR